jgi:hypothetical protein
MDCRLLDLEVASLEPFAPIVVIDVQVYVSEEGKRVKKKQRKKRKWKRGKRGLPMKTL